MHLTRCLRRWRAAEFRTLLSKLVRIRDRPEIVLRRCGSPCYRRVMALKLVIGNKNYSSWSMRPWLAMRANDIPFDEVFIPLYTGAADKERILRFTHSGQV